MNWQDLAQCPRTVTGFADLCYNSLGKTPLGSQRETKETLASYILKQTMLITDIIICYEYLGDPDNFKMTERCPDNQEPCFTIIMNPENWGKNYKSTNHTWHS